MCGSIVANNAEFRANSWPATAMKGMQVKRWKTSQFIKQWRMMRVTDQQQQKSCWRGIIIKIPEWIATKCLSARRILAAHSPQYWITSSERKSSGRSFRFVPKKILTFSVADSQNEHQFVKNATAAIAAKNLHRCQWCTPVSTEIRSHTRAYCFNGYYTGEPW